MLNSKPENSIFKILTSFFQEEEVNDANLQHSSLKQSAIPHVVAVQDLEEE